MSQLAYPFDGGAGTGVPAEPEWSNMLRSAWRGGDGVIKALDRTYDLNRLECYADSTGMRVKVKSGRAQLRGFHYVSDAEEILTVAAAHATLARIDRVVLHLDTTANTIALEVMTGTAAGSPVVPTITDTATQMRLPLARVAVAAAVSTIAAGNVTREEPALVSGYTPAGVLRRTSNQTIPHATLTDLVWTFADIDTDACTSGTGVTCRTASWYDIKAAIEWATTQTNGLRIAYLVLTRGPLGGTGGNLDKSAMTATAGETAHDLSASMYLQIGDAIKVSVLQTNAATASLDVLSSSLSSPRLSAVYTGA